MFKTIVVAAAFVLGSLFVADSAEAQQIRLQIGASQFQYQPYYQPYQYHYRYQYTPYGLHYQYHIVPNGTYLRIGPQYHYRYNNPYYWRHNDWRHDWNRRHRNNRW